MKIITNCICCIAILCVQSFAVEGIIVSVMYRTHEAPMTTPENQRPAPEQDKRMISIRIGRLIKYDFRDTKVLASDTLIRDWLVSCPAINVEGTHVAFMKYPVKLHANNNVEWLGTTASISMIPIGGGAITDLCDGISTDKDGALLDWPAGEWVYWLDNANTTVGEQCRIFRVNTTTKVKELVVDYFKSPPPTGGLPVWANTVYILRWNISADARWGIAHRMPYGVSVPNKSNDGLDWWSGTYPHCFPPPSGDMRACDPVYTFEYRDGFGGAGVRGCNPAISASGNYVSHYDGASHGFFYVKRWDHTSNDLQHMTLGKGPRGAIQVGTHIDKSGKKVDSDVATWAGLPNTLIEGGQYQRFACNSDKWHLQSIALKGEKGNMERGTQQVCANWVDKIAIIPSGNPEQQPVNNIYYNNSTGDMWIKPPQDKVGKQYVEDVLGVWHEVYGSKPLNERAANVFFTPERQVAEVIGYDDRGYPQTNAVSAGVRGSFRKNPILSNDSKEQNVYSLMGQKLNRTVQTQVIRNSVVIISSGNKTPTISFALGKKR